MSCEYVCSRCSVLANVAPVCASRGVRGLCAADDGVGISPPHTHACRASCATPPRSAAQPSPLFRTSGAPRTCPKLRVAHIQGPMQCPICRTYSLACKRRGCCHVRAFWMILLWSLSMNSKTLSSTGFGSLLGAPAFASLATGFGGCGICLSASLLRPMSLCNLLRAMPYPSVLATIRRSTSLEQIHFTMSMVGVTDGARMEQRQRSMYAVSNGWSKERATHACSR